MGMSYQDYWEGDPIIAKYFREKDKIEREQRNFEMWLQGAYVYEAILDAVPAMNYFAKERTPIPYRSELIPLSSKQAKKQEERKHQREIEAGKQAMKLRMETLNARFKNKKEQTDVSKT